MKGNKFIIMLWLGLLLGITHSMAAIVTTAGTGSVCPDNEVVIPVTVSNCDGVSAISLALNFDATKIAYQGFQNVNSQVASMLVNQSNGRIYISWANLNAVNLGNATLLELRFTGISGTSSLTWQTNLCEYSNTVGTAIQSTYTNGSVTVYAQPSITLNPVDRNIAEGQNTYFEVSATGQGLSYQWQLKAATSNEWQNLSNGGNYSNVTTRRLNVNNVSMDMNGNQYRCTVSGTCLPPVTSEAASLSVQVFVPTIVTTISSVVACADQVFSIPVMVTNCNNVGAISLALNYNQSLMAYVGYENANTGLSNGSMRVNADNGVVYFTWVSSNQTLEIGNGELISLVFKSASGNSSLSWNTSLCEYSNRYGAVIPSSYTGGTLNVYFPPSISANPTDKTVMEGSNISFSITASGDGLSYQWQMSQDHGISWETLSNGGHYSNVTNRTLNVNNVVASMDGYRFRCQVNGSCDLSLTSNYAILHVNTFVPTIVTTAGSLNTCSEIEFGIPVTVTNCNNVGAISLALSYNTDVLTYIGYEGLHPELNNGFLQVNASNGMVFIAWASSPGSSANVGNGNLITIRFSALSGTSSMNWHTAYCEYANATGVTLPASYNNGNVTVGDLSFTITSQPANQTITMEESTTFVVTTEGPTTGFQWQVSHDGGSSWNNISAGGHYTNPNTNALSVNNVPLDMNGCRYRCVISGSCGVQYSSSALLTVNLPPNYYEITLSTNPEEGGTIEGAGAYLENTSCTVTAIPAMGYNFVNWTENGNEVSQEPTYTFTVTNHRNLVAHFTLQEITISVSANPIGGGTLNGGGTYLYGSHVLLTAIPITGSVFDNWTEDGEIISTNQSISFTAQTDRTLVANFSVQQVNITATPVPANNGTIEGAGTYAYGSMVTLVAHAGQGFEFSNWTENGEVVSTNDTLSFMAENDRSFEAHFITQTLNITASVDPEVGGTIAGAGVYNYGDPVVLTAIPQGMFEFLNWTENGVEISTQPTYTFTAHNDRNLVAHFFTTITITATVQPEESGTVSGEGTYNYADPVTLTALPNTGYSFANWTEDDTFFSTETSINFTAYANRSFVAHFDSIMHHITVSANMEEAGTVSGEGDYQEGDQATVSAHPNAGYVFVCWSENGVTVSAYQNYTFAVWGPRNLVAEFALISYEVTATANPLEGGSVTGMGTFLEGETCILTAIPNEGYTFENWTKQGEIVSDSTVYSFPVTEDVNFVANFLEFQPITYIISSMVQPVGGGTVIGSGSYTMGSTCTLTAFPAHGYVFHNWTLNGSVVSNNSTISITVNENATYTANFILGLSNLHVTSITNSDFMAGQQATISWTVKNDGVGSTPVGATWNDYVWIASTVDLRVDDPNDMHLATVDNLRALDSGESYTNSVTVTLPSDLTGSQYIFVLTDMVDAFNISFPNNVPPDPYTPNITGDPYYYLTGQTHGANGGGVIMESNDYDNFFYKSVQVIPAPAPDLFVTNIAHPTDIISGTSMPLSFTIENQGVATAVGSWYDAVYLSQSSTFDLATAYHLGSYQHENGLSVGQSYTYSTNVDIPREFYDSHYVFVVTDVANTIYESIYEDNNVGRSEAPVNITMSACPNLIVTAVFAPSVMSVNKSYDISFTVQNIGAGVATESGWNDAIYLSRDEFWDYGDVAIKVIRHNNSNPLIQDATYICTTNVTIPSNVSGLWYVLVKTDKDNEVFEFLDEDDNVGHNENPSTILIPELSVTELWIDDVVDPNVPTEVEWTVKNNGSGLALGVLTDLIAFDSQMVDTVTTYIHLESNDSVVISKMVTIPCVNSSSGTISVISNEDFNIIDVDSTNNVIGNSVSVIVPDLLVEATSISEEGWSSEPIEVKYTVTNQGNASLNKMTTDRIYISNNQNDFSDATLIYSYQRMLVLGIGETENVELSIDLPDGISGTYYIGVFANDDEEICEGNNANGNGITSAINVTLSPYPNLQVVSASIESTPINIGAYATISYSVQNVGDAVVDGRSWTDRFYASPTPSYNANTAKLIGEHRTTAMIAVNETIDVSASIIIPMSINAGNYYLVMVTDADDEIYEYNGENDNQFIGAGYQFDVYPCDLQAMVISGVSEVDWGASATYTLHGKNVSDVSTLNGLWHDKLYLSADNLLSGDDVEIGSTVHNGHLEPGDEYQTVFNVTIPYGMAGDCYLIGVVDSQSTNPDINPQNNFVAEAITVNAVPVPDLQLIDLSVIDDFIAGQPSCIVYTVTNVGEIAVQNKQWNDRFYLSDDDEYSSEDLLLKTNAKNISLNVNESYSDTVEIVVPFQYGGNNYLIAKANATQSFYEPNIDDNILSAMVHVTIPSPGDLIVQNVVSEFEVVSGGRLHVSWDVKNIGENTLYGNGLKSLVYMSCDTVFDVNDKLLGSVTNSIMLPPNATTSQELSARISGVPEGDYHLIVMTNATRTFNESDFDNNTTVSINPFSVLMRVLPFNVPLTDTLENNLANDYRLNVGEFIQETVRIHLHSMDSLQGAINNIFVTHNGVGDNLNYDYSTIEQFTANPELYIPSTQLEYYGVNVIGSTPIGNEQSIMLQADVLPFDLRNISPTYGGNTGKVTIELTGSKFSVDMTAKLYNAEETIVADTVYFQSFYKAYATFDLKGKPLGVYSIGISSLCEGDAFLENAFEISQGEPERLSFNIIYPNSPRPNRNIIMMFEFGNTGNVDIIAPVIRLTSVGGSWVALTAEGLADHETDMLIPLQIEGAPQGVLRPGCYGIINIFCYTNNALVFTIKRIQ